MSTYNYSSVRRCCDGQLRETAKQYIETEIVDAIAAL